MDFGRILNTLLVGKKIELFIIYKNYYTIRYNMATTIDHSMENTIENTIENTKYFINAVKKDICNINSYYLCCLFKDIYLKNYKYCPQLRFGQIIHLWTSKNTTTTINMDAIRCVMDKYAKNSMYVLEDKYVKEAHNSKMVEQEFIIENIKKLDEIYIMFNSGVVYKEFIDCYKNGYFN